MATNRLEKEMRGRTIHIDYERQGVQEFVITFVETRGKIMRVAGDTFRRWEYKDLPLYDVKPLLQGKKITYINGYANRAARCTVWITPTTLRLNNVRGSKEVSAARRAFIAHSPLSPAEIAAELGICVQSVYRYRKMINNNQ